jgi:hypothetical protein
MGRIWRARRAPSGQCVRIATNRTLCGMQRELVRCAVFVVCQSERPTCVRIATDASDDRFAYAGTRLKATPSRILRRRQRDKDHPRQRLGGTPLVHMPGSASTFVPGAGGFRRRVMLSAGDMAGLQPAAPGKSFQCNLIRESGRYVSCAT